jgi:hypothetical protein
VSIDADGNWLMRVPVPTVVAHRDEIQRLFGRASAGSPYVNVRSLRLMIPGRDPSLFLVSLPFFWAIVMAAGWRRAVLRPLAAGSGLLLVLAVLLMSFDVVQTFITNTHLEVGAFGKSLLDSGNMAALNVLPTSRRSFWC